MRNLLRLINIFLLSATLTSVYAGSCFDEPSDGADCKVKAEQGLAAAQNSLGAMYDKGIGVTQNYKQAVKWYQKAAEQGVGYAQLSLGVAYANGQGIIQDDVMAHMYFNIAAVSGVKVAAKKRDIIAKRMTATQIEEAQRLAREWAAKHK